MGMYLQNRNRHRHMHRYPSIRNCRTGSNQPFHIVCRAEVNIGMEKGLQFQYRESATLEPSMSTCVEKLMTINTTTLYIKGMITTPWRSIFNVDELQFTRLYQCCHRHRHILHLTTLRNGTGYDQHLHIARQVEPIITKHNHFQS